MSFILLGILNSQVTASAAGAFDLLETTVLGSDAASVTFSSLGSYAATYKHLQIRAVTRSAYAGTDVIYFRLNSDTGSNYAYHYLRGTGSAVQSNRGTSTDKPWIASVDGSTAPANAFGALVIDILDFSSSSKTTTLRALSGHTGSANFVSLYSGLWNNTNAVTSITLATEGFGSSTNFVSGSRFSLYGVK